MNIDFIQKTPSVGLADEARRLKIAGLDIIELQTGDPDFITHPDIVTATHKALLDGATHYSFSSGLPRLRECLAANLTGEFKVELSSENVLITHGAVQGTSAVFSALVEFGDEVIILEPNWPTVDALVKICGGKPIKISHLMTDDALLELLQKALNKKTKMLCINSPNNPTGKVFSETRVRALVDWCCKHNLYLVSDEVYRSIVFDRSHSSALSFYKRHERIIFIDSFSKKYAMTGWRIGFVVAHVSVMKKIAKASQVQVTHVAPFIQIGALEALQNKKVVVFLETMQAEYNMRRNILMRLCKELNLSIITPQGAFYFFLEVGRDDVAFSNSLLYHHSICVVPGSSYGSSGRGYIRLTYAAQVDEVATALGKISQTLGAKG